MKPSAATRYRHMPVLPWLALALGAARIAQAQETVEPTKALEEVVVISSRIPIPLRQIGTSVSVINAADIAARGNLNLSDVLRQLTAIGVSNTGGAGKTTNLRIRGEEGFRTLTLMDGLRLSDPSTPQIAPQFEHVLSSGISRVEILRGPQGLSYGADAGGVLNISTRSGSEGLQASLDAQSGKFGSKQISANLGGAAGPADFFVSASSMKTEGFNTFAADTTFADKDGYENDTVHLRAGLDLTEHWRFDVVHRSVDGATRHDNCFSPTNGGHDCLTAFEQQASRLALAWRGDGFSHALAFVSNDTDRTGYSSGAFSYGAAGTLERWEYNGSATSLPGFKLVWGADLEAARNNGSGRDNTGVYLEYLSDFSDTLYLTAGLRHDDNDDFGTNTSHRVSAAYLVDLANAATLKFKSSIGSGFRAPSPYEIQYNSGAWAYPPASLVSLKQETSTGWEGGLEYLQGTALKLEAVYFDQDVEDAIYFDQINWSGYLQDIGTSNSKGVELSAALGLGEQWQVTGNVTFNETTRPNGLQRLRRPKQLFNAGVSWQGLDQQRLQLNAFLRAASDSIDELGAATLALAAFKVLDLSVNWRFSPSLQLYGRLENALDEHYQEVIGYNTAGRAAYVGFRLHHGGI
jgi:vitamin B12 transporter